MSDVFVCVYVCVSVRACVCVPDKWKQELAVSTETEGLWRFVLFFNVKTFKMVSEIGWGESIPTNHDRFFSRLMAK